MRKKQDVITAELPLRGARDTLHYANMTIYPKHSQPAGNTHSYSSDAVFREVMYVLLVHVVLLLVVLTLCTNTPLQEKVVPSKLCLQKYFVCVKVY